MECLLRTLLIFQLEKFGCIIHDRAKEAWARTLEWFGRYVRDA
jgi:hypothetical protein